MTWKRNGKKSLTIRGASINLPSHIPFERYEWEAMLYLVPDDFELNMTPAGRIPASNLILSYQPQRAGGAQGLINTTQQRTFSLEVPYASSWLPLAKRKNAKGESKLVNPRFQLRPLGAMVAYTVHNSRKKRSASRGSRLSRTSSCLRLRLTSTQVCWMSSDLMTSPLGLATIQTTRPHLHLRLPRL